MRLQPTQKAARLKRAVIFMNKRLMSIFQKNKRNSLARQDLIPYFLAWQSGGAADQ